VLMTKALLKRGRIGFDDNLDVVIYISWRDEGMGPFIVHCSRCFKTSHYSGITGGSIEVNGTNWLEDKIQNMKDFVH